jgi:hypothetical protein
MTEVVNSVNGLIDKLELAMLNHEPIDCPVKHTFVPGMYIREIFMPKGKEGKDNWVTSMVHNTEHPYFVLKGEVEVYSENDGVQHLKTGDSGITTPNTRRVLLIIEDTVWVTCHPTNIVPKDDSDESKEEAANLVGEQILQKYTNPLIGFRIKNNMLVGKTEIQLNN